MSYEEIEVANELAKLADISEDKADAAISGFKASANLNAIREYWNARTAKAKARVVKRNWL